MAAAPSSRRQTAAATDRTVPVTTSQTQTPDADATMTGNEEAEEAQTQSSIPSKRKPSTAAGGDQNASSSKKKDNTSMAATRFTVRNPPWTYLQLELTPQPTPSSTTAPPTIQPPLDHLTARTHLTSALSQFLGLTGTAIPIDILKLDTATNNTCSYNSNSTSTSLWIRVPRDDASAVVAAVSSWIGGGSGSGSGAGAVAFRVRGRGSWLGTLVGGKGEELFSS